MSGREGRSEVSRANHRISIPPTRRYAWVSVPVVSLMVLATFAGAMTLLDRAGAGIGPLTVYGLVADVDGNPIAGAEVTAKILYPNGTVRATRSAVTDLSGAYQVNTDFDPNQWDIGDWVKVVASHSGDYGSNATPVTADIGLFGMLSINATFPLKIAESPIALAQGWNLVALPLAGINYRASTLGLAFGDMIAGWNSTTASYDLSYMVGLSPPQSDFAIAASTGYWVYSATAKTIVVTGQVPATTQIRQCSVPEPGGWVLVGFVTLDETRLASEVPTMYSVPGAVAVVVGYDPVYRVYTSYFPGLPFTDFTLIPGQAYWIWCTVSGWLTYEP